jgi:glucosamine kinase
MSARLGVDLGATWLRACLNIDGAAAWTERVPAVNWRKANGVIRRMLRKRGVSRVDEVVLGGTRLGGAKERKAFEAALKRVARRAHVLPDFEVAHLACFGGGHGVILVGSTGSVAWAVGPKGSARAGGWGPLHGDEGSGFWLGREGSRDGKVRAQAKLPHPLKLARAEDPVRDTAVLAPKVLAAARRPGAARGLRKKAAAHLAGLALDAAKRAGLSRPWPLALHGSLFKDAGLRADVLAKLGRVSLSNPRTSAERAAAGL